MGRLLSRTTMAVVLAGLVACANSDRQTMSSETLEKGDHLRDTDARYAQLRDFIQSEMARNDAVGLGIAIIENGQIVHVEGFGMKRRGGNDPITTKTLFDIQSVTKSFTGVAAMTLVQDGLLDMSDPVTEHVPFFGLKAPYDPNSISVHNVFTHTSALPGAPLDLDPTNLPFDDTKPDALEQLFRHFNREPLLLEPGVLWNYSNFDYELAGLIVEKAGGKEYSQAVTDRVLKPLGMNLATFDNATANARDHIFVNGVGTGGVKVSIDPTLGSDSFIGRPMGGLYANTEELGRFAQMLVRRGEGILERKHADVLMSPLVSQNSGGHFYGYGVFIGKGSFTGNQDKDEVLVRAAGDGDIPGGQGTHTSITVAPESGFGIALTTNDGTFGSGLSKITNEALKIYLGKERLASARSSTPPSAWTPYVGTYFDPNNFGTMVVTLESDRLYIEFPDSDTEKVEMKQYNGDWFTFIPPDRFVPSSWLPIPEGVFGGQFWKDADGGVQYFVTRIGVGKRR